MRAGLQKMSQARSLHKELRLQVEQREVELPSIEGLIFINIPRSGAGGEQPLKRPQARAWEWLVWPDWSPHFLFWGSWGSGANLWGSDSDPRFERPRMDDGLLEVVGVTGVIHMVSAYRGHAAPMGAADPVPPTP